LLLPRFVVTRALPRLLEPVARPLRAGRRAALAFWCLFAAGAAGTLAGLGALAGMAAGPSAPRWSAATAAAAVLLLIQVCLHESGHALVCQVLRVPVRGAGFALLCWLIPVAYVDRTDAYRIRGRTGRVALAVSGPLVDGVAMGVAAAVALAGPAGPAQVARDLLVFQGFTLLLNANPLLPSDGYVAAEAALGLVDPRGRALTLLRCALLRRPLPPHLHGLRGAVRAGYLGYGLACAGYGVLILYLSAGALAGALLRLLP
jgi:putative peptide zinc metalloprotease protein